MHVAMCCAGGKAHAADAARRGDKQLAARRVRVQVDAGLVDLAAQLAPLVRGQATRPALRALLLRLLAALLLDARIELARLVLALLALLVLRRRLLRRHALDARLLTVRRLRLLLLAAAPAVVVAVAILGHGRRAGARHRAAKHDRVPLKRAGPAAGMVLSAIFMVFLFRDAV
jgi:hypothetical protein